LEVGGWRLEVGGWRQKKGTDYFLKLLTGRCESGRTIGISGLFNNFPQNFIKTLP